MDDALVLYTDGACSGNGTANARAGYGVFFGSKDPRNVAAPLEGELQTNNRAELQAILVAVQRALAVFGFGAADMTGVDAAVEQSRGDFVRDKLAQARAALRGLQKSEGDNEALQKGLPAILEAIAALQGGLTSRKRKRGADESAAEQLMLAELVKRGRPARQLVVISDSSYCVKGWTEWMANWQGRGWKTSGGKPVSNADLWQRAFALKQHVDALKGLVFTLQWTKGHRGNAGNEAADQLARDGAAMHAPGGDCDGVDP
jgi:ribonuclease HI